MIWKMLAWKIGGDILVMRNLDINRDKVLRMNIIDKRGRKRRR